MRNRACRVAANASLSPHVPLCYVSFGITVMEVRRVDLRMKLNVLAVCAVFLFVGAIVLGAF